MDHSARFIKDAARIMKDQVTIHSRTDQDSYGKPSFSTTTQTVDAYIMNDERIVVNPRGEEAFQRGVVYLTEVTNVSTDDDIELPNGERPVIIRVERHVDEFGDLVYEVIVYGDQNQGPRKG